MLKYVAIKFEKSPGQLQSLWTSSAKSAGEKSHSCLPLKAGIRQAASSEEPDPVVIPHRMALGGPNPPEHRLYPGITGAPRPEQLPAKSPASVAVRVALVSTSTVVLMRRKSTTPLKNPLPKNRRERIWICWLGGSQKQLQLQPETWIRPHALYFSWLAKANFFGSFLLLTQHSHVPNPPFPQPSSCGSWLD